MSDTTPLWDPAQYLRFGDERARPFVELVTRVNAERPEVVVDLGCGPGTTTVQLLQRWPTARITGIDSSAEMISAADALAVPGRIRFEQDDLRTWRPPQAVDVIVCNAVLQWVEGHLALLPQLLDAVTPHGWLAFQVPGNFASPSHLTLFELARSPRWRATVAPLLREEPVHEPEEYLRALHALGCRADVWTTTYLHVLEGPDAVFEWTRGTALRPVLSQLDAPSAARFSAEYRDALATAYPAGPAGTVFAFRRIFAVAQRLE